MLRGKRWKKDICDDDIIFTRYYLQSHRKKNSHYKSYMKITLWSLEPEKFEIASKQQEWVKVAKEEKFEGKYCLTKEHVA